MLRKVSGIFAEPGEPVESLLTNVFSWLACRANKIHRPAVPAKLNCPPADLSTAPFLAKETITDSPRRKSKKLEGPRGIESLPSYN